MSRTSTAFEGWMRAKMPHMLPDGLSVHPQRALYICGAGSIIVKTTEQQKDLYIIEN